MRGSGQPEAVRPRILVVDDQRDVRSLLDHQLENEQFLVESAADGEEAIDRVESGEPPPDAIVLDLSMPVMDGFETLRRLQEADAGILTVVLSSHDEEEKKLRAFDLGADDFVGKPFSPPVLAKRLRRHLRREHRSMSEWPERWHAAVETERDLES